MRQTMLGKQAKFLSVAKKSTSLKKKNAGF